MLLVGGARSGKSRLAIERAEREARPVVFIATAQAGDAEMAERIERHRRERPSSWDVVEEHIELARALAEVPEGATAVMDCLSLWVANLLDRPTIEELACEAAAAAAGRPGLTIAVTNEVGLGIVPDNALARRYRDVLGRVNALWADAADEVYLVVAGRTLALA